METSSANTQELGRLSALEQLKKGCDYALIIVVAPAGAGKTTLLRRWADGCGCPVAWVSLEPEHNRPGCFLSHVASALNRTGLDFKYDESVPDETMDDGIIELLNAIIQHPDPIVLVLDNYHVIDSPVIHKGIALLLDYVPPRLHLIIGSRTAPPLQLPRLRVRRQLLELQLTIDHSQFTTDK